MAYSKPVEDWKPLWWFPFIERRWVGLYSSHVPGVPVDNNAFWREYRWR